MTMSGARSPRVCHWSSYFTDWGGVDDARDRRSACDGRRSTSRPRLENVSWVKCHISKTHPQNLSVEKETRKKPERNVNNRHEPWQGSQF